MDPLSADIKQSRTTRNSSGARDSRSLKANKNKSVEASEMPDLQAEAALSERLRTRRASEGGTMVPGKLFNRKIIQRILELTRQGYSFSEMAKLSKVARFPSLRSLHRWKTEDAEFAEALESAYTEFVDDRARGVLPMVERMTSVLDMEKVKKLAQTMPRVKGLKPFERVSAIDRQLQRTIQAAGVQVNAMDSRAQRTLQVAGSRDPKRWGGKGEEAGGIMIYEIALGDVKKYNLPGSVDGQNVKALEAMRKDKKLLAPQVGPGPDAESGAAS